MVAAKIDRNPYVLLLSWIKDRLITEEDDTRPANQSSSKMVKDSA